MDFFLQSPMNLFFAALAVCSGVMLLWQGLAGRNISRLSPTQASVLISAHAQIIDVREVEAFAGGHIKNSKSLPFSQIVNQLPLLKFKKNKPVIIVCERGSVAARAITIFNKNEYMDIHVLEGGLKGWRDAQLPVVKG